jgi:hypothetical protein
MPSTTTTGTRTRRRRPRRGVLSVAVTLAAAAVAMAGVLLPAQPAAAVAGLQYIDATSEVSSTTVRVLTVNCPAGTHGLGGALFVNNGAFAKIHGIVPSPTGVTFYATEVSSAQTANWSFFARATCAPDASLPGLEYVHVRRTCQATRSQASGCSELARCSGNKQVIGAGGFFPILQNTDKLFFTSIIPQRTLVGAKGTQTGFDGTFDLEPIAVCVDPNPDLEIVSASSNTQDRSSPSAIQVSCPDTKIPQAAGFSVFFQTGPGVEHVFAHRTEMAAPRDVKVLGAEDESGTEAQWALAAYAICG